MQRLIARNTRDSGISLIEVIVALVLIGAISATALVFFVRGMSNTTHLQRTQNASAVATQAMEAVRSIDPRSGTGIASTPLVTGRTMSEVNAAWSAAEPSDVVDMARLHDNAATSGQDQLLPIYAESEIDGFTYDVTTLIGRCEVTRAAIDDEQSCTTASPVGAIPMIRVRIIVEWSDGNAGVCPTHDCTYRLTSLIDPSEDANWNLSTKPVAYDDAGTFTIGDVNMPMEILANDVYTTFTSNPTTILAQPALGSATVVTSGARMGAINYSAPAAAPGAQSGATNFTYKIRDAQGRNSNTASVNLVILPLAKPDSATVARNSFVDIPVLDNDFGTNLRAEVSTAPSASVGNASVNADGTIRFTPRAGSSATSATFEYVVHDDYTSTSAPVVVTVTISAPSPTVGDLEFSVPAQASAAPQNLIVPELTAGRRINIVSGPTSVTGSQDPAGQLTTTGNRNSLRYTPPANKVGVFTFVYTIQDGANGTPSPEATGTIIVHPVANPHEIRASRNSNQRVILSSAASNIPRSVTPGITYELGASSCAVPPILENVNTGQLAVRTPTVRDQSCTVDYTIRMEIGDFTYDKGKATLTVRAN